MTKIGIDFGTTNSAVCCLDENKEVQAIPFGGAANAANYIPSCVAIRTGVRAGICIGSPARLKLGVPEHRVYTNFKMLLGESDADKRRKWGYPDRSPDDVASMYFRHLMDDVRKHLGHTPRSVVVTIPEVWTRQGLLGKRERLIAACKEAGIQQVKLHSEPLAASVYFLHLYRKKYRKPYAGYVLVCDCGGGTLDFCLVRVAPGADDKEQVTAVHRTGNGLVGESLGKAGVAYDEAVTEALFPGRRSSDPARYFKSLREFEEYKIVGTEEFRENIRLYREESSLAGDAITHVDGQGVTAQLLCGTFDTLIRPGLLDALKEMGQYLSANRINVDDSESFRVLPVGGFSAYEPVMDTIRTFFGSRTEGDRRFETLLSPQDTALAIAKGAALIAEEQVEIKTLCPVTLGIYVTIVVDGRVSEEPEPILNEGTVLSTYHQPTTSPKKLASTPGSTLPLTIYLKEGGREYPIKLNQNVGDLLPTSYGTVSSEHYLRCGFSVDENLVFTFHAFHHAPDNQLKGRKDTSLGKIIDLFGSFRTIS